MLEEERCMFYGLDEAFHDPISFNKIFENLSLPEQVEVVKRIDWMFMGKERNVFIESVRSIINESASDFCYDVPSDAYDVCLSDIIEDFRYEDESGGHIDGDSAADALESTIKDMVSDELSSILSDLPSDIDPEKKQFSDIEISVSGTVSAVESYLRDDYDNEYDSYRENEYWDDTIIDYIFNR